MLQLKVSSTLEGGITTSTPTLQMNDYGKDYIRWSHVIVIMAKCSFPGIQKPLDQYGPATADASDSSPAKKAEDAADDNDDEDDGFDLFGSDDEEEVCSIVCDVTKTIDLDKIVYSIIYYIDSLR